MRAIWAVLACVVAVGCSDSPDASGMPPRAVLGDDLAESVRAEVELIERELPDPIACDFVVAAAFGWLCNGDVCPSGGICDSTANLGALDIELSATCPVDIETLSDSSAECSRHDISSDALDCALRAQSSKDFACCFRDTTVLTYPALCG